MYFSSTSRRADKGYCHAESLIRAGWPRSSNQVGGLTGHSGEPTLKATGCLRARPAIARRGGAALLTLPFGLSSPSSEALAPSGHTGKIQLRSSGEARAHPWPP